MTSYIRKLIEQGEHQRLDFKYAITDSKKIARSLVAFANTDGGTLLIGVKDNGVISGVRDDEEFYMVQAAAQMYSKPEIFFESRLWEEGDRSVLEIIVPKSDQRPHSAPNEDGKWMVYIRVHDQNLLANKILLDVWHREKNNDGIFIKFSEKEKILFDYFEQNDTITLSKYCRIARLTNFKAEKILADLILLKLIEIEITEKNIIYKLNKANIDLINDWKNEK